MSHWSRRLVRSGLVLLGIGAVGVVPAGAGEPFVVIGRPGPAPVPGVLVPTSRPANAAPSPMLGTFYPGPYMTFRSNFPVGGGYSPLGVLHDQSLAIYGPLSAYRAEAAPVRSYERGYDGRLYPSVATGFSYPNRALLAPVVYPTRGAYYFAPRHSGTPPAWFDASGNWIDQD